MILRNKDDQYGIVQLCSARPYSLEVGEIVIRELNNSSIFLVFSPCSLKYFQLV